MVTAKVNTERAAPRSKRLHGVPPTKGVSARSVPMLRIAVSFSVLGTPPRLGVASCALNRAPSGPQGAAGARESAPMGGIRYGLTHHVTHRRNRGQKRDESS